MLCISGCKNTDFLRYFYYFCKLDKQNINGIKKALKIFWLTMVAFAAILFAIALAIQTPGVQTRIADKAARTLSEKIDGDITFEKIHFKPFTTLVLKNIMIIDKSPAYDPMDSTAAQIDTFFRAEYIIAKFTLKGLRSENGLHLDKATISNAQMNLVLEDSTNSHKRKENNLARIFGLKQSENKKQNDKELFHVRNVELKGFNFRMKNYTSYKTPLRGGINWNDLDIYDIDIIAQDLQFKGRVMSGDVEHLSFKEKSGYVCNQISGNTKVGNGKTVIKDLRLDDPWSDLKMPLFMMTYDSVKSFKDFIALVKMDAEIEESVVDFRTLTYFSPIQDKNKLVLNVKSGGFEGTVDDFCVKKIQVASTAGGFEGTITGRVTGIPEIEQTSIDAKIDDFKLTSAGLSHFVSQWMRDGSLDLSHMAPGTTFRVTAHASGPLNNLAIETDIRSAIGQVDGNIRLEDLIDKTRQLGISGKVSTENLNIGKVIGKDIIGETTMKAIVQAKLANDDEALSAAIDSLNVSRLHVHGYDYSNISGSGTLSKDAFDGRITCNDPNLNFMFHGRLGLSPRTQNTIYKFYAIVGHADLNAMNIDTRGRSDISFRTSADFRRTKKGDIYGDISVDNLIVENSDRRSDIGQIKLTSVSKNDTYRMWLKSAFANGTFTGTAPVTDFIKDLGNITLRRELPSLFADPQYTWSGNRYSLDFEFEKMQDLLDFVYPGLYIADNTTLSTKINDKGRLAGALNSQRIAFGSQYLKDLTLNFNNNDGNVSGELYSNEMEIATMKISDNSFRILADDDHIGIGYTYNNQSELENRGEFFVHGDLERIGKDVTMDVNILPSMLYLNSREWKIQPSHLKVAPDGIQVSSVEFLGDEQRISLHGNVSKTQRDTLTLELDRFDISIINPLLGADFGIRGAATGQAQLTSPLSSKGLLADMICDSTYLAGMPLGVVTLGSRWDEDFERFEITAKNEMAGLSQIDAFGKLTPKNRSLEATANLDRLHVGYAKPLLTNIFSDLSGYISGQISVDGPVDALSVTSNGTVLEEGMLQVAYTNVPYYADGDFHLDDTGVYFDDIKIRDRYTGTGIVSGSINWSNFKDIYFDTRIKANEIEGINLNEKQNKAFYGNLFATGLVSITGPTSTMQMNVDAVTAKTGEIHIPVAAATTSGSTNLLKFTELKKDVFIDPYEIMRSKIEKKNTSENKFLTYLHINANPDVTAFVEIDKASGHVLSGKGNGTLDMSASSDAFSINGDYTLTGGNYKFAALGLVTRDFEIQDGSSVTFNGDILESTLNIDALYKTKASLSTLIADTTSVGNRRTIECGIEITDKLANPRLGFSIEIPDIDPTIKSRVESALSTEDKVQKQFLSILLYNSFLPDEQSGIFNNSNMLYSSVSEVMAGQLSNILQKLNIPVDLGLNYQPNDKGNDVFDVAVSTQMFNNRVSVNGSVGNKQYSSGSEADVVGDIDIEIKLNRAGSFRLNLFSHSADSYTNYLDNSQRNGVGLTYQTEFNSFRQFLKNIFSSKKKRQEAKQAEEQAMIDGKRVEINITD